MLYLLDKTIGEMIMFYLVSGIPGCGKTEILKKFSLKHKSFKIINDKEFAKKHNTGTFDKKDNEYLVDISKLNKAFVIFIKDTKNKDKEIIFEGHLWCEMSKSNLSKFTQVFVFDIPEKLLRERLEKRKYHLVKIEENIFCRNNRYIENLFEKKGISFKKVLLNNNINDNVKLFEMFF